MEHGTTEPNSMELGTIRREILVEASPAVVFEVISRPEHMREWWPDDASFEPIAGSVGELVWRNADSGETKTVEFAIVDVDPPRRFSFRWCHLGPHQDGASLLVTFELAATDGGTTITMTETGFREMGWEIAVLEETYQDHVNGWSHFIPRLGTYVHELVGAA